ncbi:putative Fe-S cluster assembly domain superfamily, MIP18 family [Helianthus annuus]|uniref:Fe-S cluster assembly domain superfamily, MIP18 family n=1 Tax=Helianthus annuus TaxID=4232 RepID=A0A251TEX5_HELAN|nr:putative Fe-S cluster assembly domain superfamily, MIP18 family [Helianthus annuus]KAJ0512352.1 putative Fe-S cluster assembly domain superfamily, MIP18 family [Helianthus annuus]KAJ0528452.1 putative Fe-S cluster assembly domain superfamily, MIP18 family [Helianthus annuus]KAJ0695395.1 putative Fe-S cluster assembly domain superfamily, MIP18 family [Helianthus annuus]KAJ0882100.1 putative Fe-S cluster assembly domain superfamily, MIP18 family [Helianthus annuus]
MTLGLINANPIVREKKERTTRPDHLHLHSNALYPLDIYDILSNVIVIFDFSLDTYCVRDIRDPEHPYSLEQLSVLSEDSITVNEKLARILENLCEISVVVYGWSS